MKWKETWARIYSDYSLQESWIYRKLYSQERQQARRPLPRRNHGKNSIDTPHGQPTRNLQREGYPDELRE